MQTDPIGYEDQMNLYDYVGNDPMKYKDPNGLCRSNNGSPSNDCPQTSEDSEDEKSTENEDDSVEKILVNGVKLESCKPNGCGSGWNEPYIPEELGNFDFSQACKNHDICFTTKGKSLQQCNEEFTKDMYKAVNSANVKKVNDSGGIIFGDIIFGAISAGSYRAAVDTFGDKAYEDAQNNCN